jgi:hypothetical protein
MPVSAEAVYYFYFCGCILSRYTATISINVPSVATEMFLFISSGRIRPVGFTQHLTEMSTRSRKIMFLGSKVWRVRKADNFTAIY